MPEPQTTKLVRLHCSRYRSRLATKNTRAILIGADVFLRSWLVL